MHVKLLAFFYSRNITAIKVSGPRGALLRLLFLLRLLTFRREAPGNFFEFLIFSNKNSRTPLRIRSDCSSVTIIIFVTAIPFSGFGGALLRDSNVTA